MSTSGHQGATLAKEDPFSEEQGLIDRRRRDAGETDNAAPRPVYGLALSGGGIRSATFSLGVMRGLAKQNALHLFDYLSTVSGGGYIGAAYGRLFSAAATASAVEACVADDRSMFLWWLRNNGRYLVPAGAKDDWLAAASAIRGWISSQFSFLVLVLCMVALVLLPHAIVWARPAWAITAACTGWVPSAWLVLALVPAWLALVLMWSYYLLALHRWAVAAWTLVAFSLLAIAVWWCAGGLETSLWCQLDRGRLAASGAALVFASIVPSGLVLAWQTWGPPKRLVGGMKRSDPNQLAIERLRLTVPLRTTLILLSMCFGAALLDAVSWRLFASAIVDQKSLFGGLGSVAGGLVAALAAVRAALPSLQGRSSNAWIRNVDWFRVANVVGILAIVVIVFLVTLSLTFAIYTPGETAASPSDSMGDYTANWMPVAWLVGLLAGLALLIAGTGSQIESLNLASLHYLYRARLARAYISLGNGLRFPSAGSPLSSADRTATNGVKRVDEALPGDDVLISSYRPHLFGGPLHLINCCINQTRDDRTGNYNADRLGIALTVGPCGFETGAEGPKPLNPSAGTSSLAEWISVSGAAVSSGMGAYTRMGVAALLYLSGLRLGYWMKTQFAVSSIRQSWRVLPKFRAVYAEALGAFPGLRAGYWYASDGGHFDNTGVYALIKRKLPLIVLVDAGADPDYLFGDVENLVRKAKIDYDAAIDFIDPATLPLPIANRDLFGTPYSVVAEAGPQFLLLARIRYCTGERATLLIIKPRRTDGLSLDVVGYADRHPAFPQESTAHQLFSEQQWESYHSLGVEFGKVLQPNFLATLHVLSASAAVLPFPPLPTDQPQSLQPANDRTARVQQTVRTTLGVGVSVSLLLGVWQAVQGQLNSAGASRTNYYNTLKTVTDELEHDCVVPAKLAASLAALRDASLAVGDSAARSAEMRNVGLAAGAFCEPGLAGCYLEYFPRLFPTRNATPATTQTWYWSYPAQPVNGSDDVAVRAISPAGTTKHNCVNREDVYSDGTRIDQPIQFAQGATIRQRGSGLASATLPLTATGTIAAGTPAASVPLANPTTSVAAAASIVQPTPLPPRTNATPALTPGEACSAGGIKRTLYPQVYRHEDLKNQQMTRLLDSARNVGLKVTASEDVVATAQRRGSSSPFVWSRPTFLYASPSDQACAEALAATYGSGASGHSAIAMALPRSLAGTPGSIEFWLPPGG